MKNPNATVFTAHDPGDIVGMVPTLFGFRPRESLIAVATNGPRCRFGFRLRIDLPDGPSMRAKAAEAVVHHLRRQRAEGAVVLALSDDHEAARAAVCAVLERLIAAGIEPIVIAWADDDRYWQPIDGFPESGLRHQLAAMSHPAVVQAVVEGQEIVSDRRELVARFAGPEGLDFDKMVRLTFGQLPRVLGIFGRNPDESDLINAAVSELDPILDRALNDHERMSDEDVVAVALWLSSIAVRDEIWSRIDLDNADDWLRVLTDVAQRTVPPFEPSVLCLAGFAAWMRGDGTQALIALERSEQADPQYSLTQLLLQALLQGISPEEYLHRR